MNSLPFVKKFDFRGVYNKDILDKDSFYVALALNEVFNPKKILLGWDTRESSKSLASSAIQALSEKGVEICYLDKVPIDYVTAASYACDFDFSIMFTGSHNTWEWTGMLIHEKGGKSLKGENVTKVVEEYKKLIDKVPFKKQEVLLDKFYNFESDIEKIYADKIMSLIPISEIKTMEVGVDIGDGSGFKALDLLERLLPQVNFIRLCDNRLYNENTIHVADPSEEINMQHLKDFMKENPLAAGFVFDSDGDRVLAIDERHNTLNGSIVASGLIQIFSMLGLPDRKTGYAVECGPSFYNTVVDLNKTNKKIIDIQAIPVGRSIVRGLVFDEKLDFGFENVGHFYIKDFFMTDSAVFVLTCLLYWISVNGNLSKLSEKHPDGSRIQTSIELSRDIEQLNDKLVQEIKQKFESDEIKVTQVDGVRIEIYDNEYMRSWIAFRKSGYEAKEKYYAGSIRESDFNFLKQEILRLKV